jgi:hypothetical protein
MMALPALGGHHHLPPAHGHAAGHAAAHPRSFGADHAPAPRAPGHPPAPVALATTAHGSRRLIPSPRALFSLCALYGACGNALVHAGHFTPRGAALLAVAPALLLEWLLIRPVWNLLFRYRADASSPLEALILAEARAVVPFRNGRGLVTIVRDGRHVQLSARLCDAQAALPVAFGQRLRVEDIDARHERVTVSLLPDDNATNNST